jgi:hypothetical protein
MVDWLAGLTVRHPGVAYVPAILALLSLVWFLFYFGIRAKIRFRQGRIIEATIEARGRLRNRYVGSYQETPFEPVALSFTIPALQQMLRHGATPDAPYTHQQICDWAERFALTVREDSFKNYEPFAVEDESAQSLEVAEDVGAQWDLFLSNTYTLSELQSLDFAGVTLPHEWFEKWSRKLAVDAVLYHDDASW